MPKIRSDSINALGITEFIIVLDSNPEERFDASIAVSDPTISGNIIFEYDVTGVSVGNHTIRVGADNGWETTWGNPDPLVFTRPVPVSAFGISLVLG